MIYARAIAGAIAAYVVLGAVYWLIAGTVDYGGMVR